jgi:hypothetical protein
MKARIAAKLKGPRPACECGQCPLCHNRARRLDLRQREARLRAASAKTDAELDREAAAWLRKAATS